MPPLYPRWTSVRNLTRSFPSRSAPFVVTSLALALAGFAAGLQASEIKAVQRSAEVARYESIEIDTLPLHQSQKPSTLSGPQSTPSVSAPPPAMIAARTTVRREASASSHSALMSRIPREPVRGTIEAGQSIGKELARKGVAASTIDLVARSMRSEFDFRRALPGQSYWLRWASDGELQSFRYRLTDIESIHLFRKGDGYQVRREYAVLQPEVARLQGNVDSSLYLAIRSLGEDPTLANDFADIFAWDVDFTRHLRRGDQFEIVYQQLFRNDDDGSRVYVRPGRILAAHFSGSAGDYTAVWFEDEKGIGNYYRPDGNAIQREYLAAPLKFSRISSRYSSARPHPILKVTRPHHGIDYAAEEGTPVWSVADGTVIYRGWGGGFGNLVKVRHSNGYVSYYSHLSRFGEGLSSGQKVRQKEVIGYVGHTGLATGPHVCFRVTRNGHYVNPAMIRGAPEQSIVKQNVEDESWADFQVVRDQLLAGLRDSNLELIENAI